ncbi:putative PEP-binding protein, partial [Paraburkholderia sp. SIMBA_049]
GRLHVDADALTLQRAIEERDTREQRLKVAAEQRHQPALTTDGHAVEVFANIGESAGVTSAVEQGAEGIGLLRTELIFMAHPQAPDEATQE